MTSRIRIWKWVGPSAALMVAMSLPQIAWAQGLTSAQDVQPGQTEYGGRVMQDTFCVGKDTSGCLDSFQRLATRLRDSKQKLSVEHKVVVLSGGEIELSEDVAFPDKASVTICGGHISSGSAVCGGEAATIEVNTHSECFRFRGKSEKEGRVTVRTTVKLSNLIFDVGHEFGGACLVIDGAQAMLEDVTINLNDKARIEGVALLAGSLKATNLVVRNGDTALRLNGRSGRPHGPTAEIHGSRFESQVDAAIVRPGHHLVLENSLFAGFDRTALWVQGSNTSTAPVIQIDNTDFRHRCDARDIRFEGMPGAGSHIHDSRFIGKRETVKKRERDREDVERWPAIDGPQLIAAAPGGQARRPAIRISGNCFARTDPMFAEDNMVFENVNLYWQQKWGPEVGNCGKARGQSDTKMCNTFQHLCNRALREGFECVPGLDEGCAAGTQDLCKIDPRPKD